jgi:hypothetical protein
MRGVGAFSTCMVDKRQRLLRDGLLLFESNDLTGRIRNVRDIFTFRHVLKQSPFNVQTVNHLAHLVRDALHAGARFRVFDSLKVLRAIIVAGNGQNLPAPTVRVLFDIYRHLILKSREEIQWCLSRLIKDQTLNDDGLTWLIDHWSQSTHLVNRLLLYPKSHPKIVEWARSRYDAWDLTDRRSELIGILLASDGVAAFRHEQPETLAWAIMRSSLTRSAKIRHLSSLATGLPANTLVTFAIRLNAPLILRNALKSAPAGPEGLDGNAQLSH